jgi:cytochrome c oxidase cbb3-type subunit 3
MINLVKKISIGSLFLTGVNAYAQDAAAAVATAAEKAPEATSNNPLFISMGVLTGVLLFVIVILSAVLRTSVKTKVREVLSARNIQAVVAALFIFGAQSSFAQAAAETKESMYVDTAIGGMHPLAFYSLFIVLLLELFVILWLCLMILRIIVKREAASAVAHNEKPAQSSFSLFISRKIFGVKPVETDKDVMLDHDYDGIREFDNDLPPWWKYGFYFTIISGVIYLIGYHVTGSFKSSQEEYNTEIAEAEASVAAYRNKMALNVDETNAVFATESDKLAKGGEIFVKNCVVCHGDKGQGGIGPNFADNYWIYGGKPGDLFKTVKNGTTKGMKSWKDELSPVDIQNVISYIHTFKGTNPPNQKAPEGNLFEETAGAAIDSAATAIVDSTKNIEVK